MSESWWLSFAQGILLLVAAPAILGWLNWWKARLNGRRRALGYLLQPYRNLFKLLRVPPTHSQATSWVFRWTPYIVFTAYGSLLFTLPIFATPLLDADLVLILYLLGLARFTLSLSGLDSASAFGGLGSNREMFFHFLTEISFFVLIVAFLLWSGNATGLTTMQIGSLFRIAPPLTLTLAFFPALLLETRRLPLDNPGTHLELTMAGKAIELEFSGRDLALIEWAEMSKLLFMLSLLPNLLLSLLGHEEWLFVTVPMLWLLTGPLLAFWEWQRPKLRLGQIPSAAQTSLLFSLFAILLRLIPGG